MNTFKALFAAACFAIIAGTSTAQTSIQETPIEKIRLDDPGDRIQDKHTGKYDFVDVDEDGPNDTTFSWYELFFTRIHWLVF